MSGRRRAMGERMLGERHWNGGVFHDYRLTPRVCDYWLVETGKLGSRERVERGEVRRRNAEIREVCQVAAGARGKWK